MPEKFDSIGAVRLLQSRRGVKASLDGLLLAWYSRPLPGWLVADLGCGNGFVGLLMASREPGCRVVGVEIQGPLIRQAAHGARVNRLGNAAFVRADLKNPPWKKTLGLFDLVAANPPYRRVGTGRLSPDPARAAARHETLGDAGDFALAAASLLRRGGRAVWVYLWEREGDLLETASNAGLHPARLRRVHSREGEDPALVLLETVKGEKPGCLLEDRPLILYRPGKGREYTREAREIVYGGKKGKG